MPDYKILIADYEPRGIKQLQEPLEREGYRVEIAKDGVRAIEAFNSFKPHLTLIEAMLPKKHGFEVCQELKKTQHGSMTPIVIVTSVYKGRKYRTQALHHYGCDEYLEKPIDAEQLRSIVKRLIDERCSVPLEAAPRPTAEPRKAAPAAATATAEIDSDAEAEAEISDRLDEILPGSRPPRS
jgi:DNA-binding response OmpR family regulator